MHFKEENNRSGFFSLNLFFKKDKQKRNRYKRGKLFYLMQRLIWKIGHDYLREEKHLIYSLNSTNFSPSFNYNGRGFSLSCELKNLKSTLDESYKMFYEYWESFLESSEGNLWFEGEISDEIFKRSVSFNEDYAEYKAIDILKIILL
ncbi:MAG: hypothetical protein Q9M91_07365 [Candidatus Dojkabacteria bacterium]|nr:hypothetical protein [Candidatus Dojkabacteria bacterium]MDQ7021606.1 hypothetical protein [Candidatus Dojkabacteria bacterium]